MTLYTISISLHPCNVVKIYVCSLTRGPFTPGPGRGQIQTTCRCGERTCIHTRTVLKRPGSPCASLAQRCLKSLDCCMDTPVPSAQDNQSCCGRAGYSPICFRRLVNLSTGIDPQQGIRLPKIRTFGLPGVFPCGKLGSLCLAESHFSSPKGADP